MVLADVNVLLATTVQSGAGLVAIVGGLLGSRYVALDAEQQAARRRHLSASQRLVTARLLRDQADHNLAMFRVREALEDSNVYLRLASGGPEPKLEDVLEPHVLNRRDLRKDLLLEHLDFLRGEFARALSALREIVPVATDHPPWQEVRQENGFEPRDDDLWEWLYEELCKAREEEARKAQKAARAERYGKSFAQSPAFDRLHLPRPPVLRVSQKDEERRLQGAQDETTRAQLQAEAEVQAARMHVEDTEQPQGFGLALRVLAFLAATTIFYPAVLIVAGPTHLPLMVRISVALAFFAGVGMLLWYLFVYSIVLSKRSGQSEMPKGLLGLLSYWRPSMRETPSDPDPGSV